MKPFDHFTLVIMAISLFLSIISVAVVNSSNNVLITFFDNLSSIWLFTLVFYEIYDITLERI